MDLAGWMKVSDLAHFHDGCIVNNPEKYQIENVLLVQRAQVTVAGRAEGIFGSEKTIGSILGSGRGTYPQAKEKRGRLILQNQTKN